LATKKEAYVDEAYTTAPPAGWKDYDTFVKTMNEVRLPTTKELAGKSMSFKFDSGDITVKFNADTIEWTFGNKKGNDTYWATLVAPNIYFLNWIDQQLKDEAHCIVVDTNTYRAVHVFDYVKKPPVPGEPPIGQTFAAGVLLGGTPTGMVPCKTKELTGLHAIYTYKNPSEGDEGHSYEHYYTTSEYFCWKGLAGPQKGDCAMEPAEYWKFADNQFVFGWTEVIIPCSPVWFICFDGSFGDNYETGTFYKCNSDKTLKCELAGATIEKLVTTYYPKRFGKL